MATTDVDPHRRGMPDPELAAAATWSRPSLPDNTRLLYPLLRLAALFAIWEVVVTVISVPTYLVPAPSDVFTAMLAQSGRLFSAAQITLTEMVSGFLFGSLFSISFGLLVVYWAPAKTLLMPYMVMLHAIPKVALAPLFIIWFGFGLKTNIIYTALVAFFPVLINFIQGLEDVNPNESRLMASYNASRWQMFRHIHFYRSLPYLFAGLKMAAVLAMIGAVVSEFVAGDGGLGYYMVQAQNLLRAPDAFAALVILTLLGYGFYMVIDLLHRWLTPWAPSRDIGGQDVA
jgi:NitT/TauT family transport system permease protein